MVQIQPLGRGLAAAVVLAAAHGAPPPAPFDTENAARAPMPAAEVAARIQMPAGFRATVFAAEPDVRQPIAMTTDSRGRLWVAENYTYSEVGVGYHPELRDRIVIFEDADNDGRFDRRTVFWEGAQRLTSIEVGLGGVWAITLPNLVFLPDRDGNDVPDTEPQVLLEGFDHIRNRHNVANGLRWGPDGWLYGRHGITSPSRVGRPGVPEEQRTLLSAGIWRFHPRRLTFEVVANGTTNPWGLDWDAHGEPFFINTVIGHLWYLIPGAHYERMRGDDPNPHIYELIPQHGDHVHWATAEKWQDARKGVTNATSAAGGGHAHTGLIIYQGGQWPAEWNGKLLTSNFHGRRLNVERIEPVGSAWIGRHEPDAFQFPDPWFRGLDLIAAPDGGVFVSDWSDAGDCHDNDGVSRSTGRIYKLTYGPTQARMHGDLAKWSALELARLQTSSNDWLARQARRVLVDRAASGAGITDGLTELSRMEARSPNPVHRLRALWARHAADADDVPRLHALLDDSNEHVRAWAIRLLFDSPEAGTPEFAAFTKQRLPELAMREPSAHVRLTLASALQRIPVQSRAPLASALLTRREDAADHNLPLMLWYGIAGLAGDRAFEPLIIEAGIPLVQRLGARRLAEDIDTRPERIDTLLEAIARPGVADGSRRAVLDGIAAALGGRREVRAPRSWARACEQLLAGANDALRGRIRELSVLFGDAAARAETRRIARESPVPVEARRRAFQLLIDVRDPELRSLCADLLRIPGLSALAAAGLALIDDPTVAEVLLSAWRQVASNERSAVMNALLSRPEWASRVLDAVEQGTLPRTDLGAGYAQQIRALKDPVLTQRLAAAMGAPGGRAKSAHNQRLEEWRRRFTPEILSRADHERGRTFFQAVCAGCHRLNGQGGTIGPDLTGSNRDNLEYLLENILFPSATLADAYRLTVLTMKDGRVLTGLVHDRAGRTLKLQSGAETLSIDTVDIVAEERSDRSLMPEGLLDALGEEPARDLIAYVMAKDSDPSHSR